MGKRKRLPYVPAKWGHIEAVVAVKIPAEEIARLRPEQANALMTGLGQVLSAARPKPKGRNP